MITLMFVVGELRAEDGVYPAKMEMVFVDTETGASVNIESGMEVSIRVEN